MDAVRILLVDDSSAQRHILRHRMEGHPELVVVGEAGGGREAVVRFSELRPDVVLLDLVMPDMGGEEVLSAILAMDPGANVIIVSSLGTRDAVERCLRGGARSFLQKPFEVEDLLRTLDSVLSHT